MAFKGRTLEGCYLTYSARHFPHLLAQRLGRGVCNAVAAVLTHLAHALPHIGHLDHDGLLWVVAVPVSQALAHPLHSGLVLAE